ncbi:type ISP restriction/modification enzyme [Streptomyces melanosporofaciens]|uniref:type ISP restriction/modification enzyme n=1 Tax=Streptomyces melanosporofaciens TaxID=67327 RepID=UPI0014300E2A|nr:type ISP restriction/modification enzyme [Streptomyces melanosporofaciens]
MTYPRLTLPLRPARRSLFQESKKPKSGIGRAPARPGQTSGPSRKGCSCVGSGHHALHLGGGHVSPVPAEVWNYDVGGMQIIKKWFGYRKANSSSRKTSPLGDLHVESWPADWSRELRELLSVLRRLVDLAPAQQDLLDRVLAAPTITTIDLEKVGILPVSDKARKPHRGVVLPEAGEEA